MTDHRSRGRAKRLVAVLVALFTVPAAFLVVALAATAETRAPVTAGPFAAAEGFAEPCDTTMTECPEDPPTETTTEITTTTTTTTITITTTTTTTTTTTAPPATGGGGGGSGGGGGGGGGGSAPRAPVVPPATTMSTPPVSAIATVAATQVAVQPTGGESQTVAAPAPGRMPSGVMIGSTAGILVAFAVSVGFLVRERRAFVREREEDELEHWRDYR